MSRAVGLIPARLNSSRLPRKALVDILGLPMVVHVYRRCLMAKSLSDVFVCTDSTEIYATVTEMGGKAIMTSSEHETGTDRIAEAARKLDYEIVVNIQGDEALVDPGHIDAVVSAVQNDPNVNVALLVNPYNKYNSPSDIKAVLDENNNIMYLSRTDLPSSARTPNPPMFKAYHIVPFRRDFLFQYAAWPKGKLERIEFNEYLRILEKGYKIKAVQVESSAVSVDTAEDLAYVREKMPSDIFYPKYK